MGLQMFEKIGDVVRDGHARLVARNHEYSKHPTQRRLMMTSAAITFGTLCVARVASADGVADMGTKAAEQGDSMKESMAKLFTAVGFGGAGYGGYNMWKKSKEGENSRISGMQIWGPLLGGAALGATSFMMLMAGETVGIDSGEQGTVPG